MQHYFQMFCRYNEWANRRLYKATAVLPEPQVRSDLGAFFGSLIGTLNHILVADRIWMHRFTGEGPIHTDLEEIVAAELSDLTRLREAEDARILAYVDGLAPADFSKPLHYRTIVKPTGITQPLAPALGHFFNHQTHHRGQAHALLTRIGGRDAAPSFDLIMFQRETGAGLA